MHKFLILLDKHVPSYDKEKREKLQQSPSEYLDLLYDVVTAKDDETHTQMIQKVKQYHVNYNTSIKRLTQQLHQKYTNVMETIEKI